MFNGNEDGFSLLETLVVLAIIAVLLAVGVPSLAGYRARAQDSDSQSDLRVVALVEKLHYLDNTVYTADTATLSAAEGTVEFNVAGDPVGSVRVITGNGDQEFCLFAQSHSGRWWAIYHTATSGSYFGQASPATCNASLASGWSTDGW